VPSISYSRWERDLRTLIENSSFQIRSGYAIMVFYDTLFFHLIIWIFFCWFSHFSKKLSKLCQKDFASYIHHWMNNKISISFPFSFVFSDIVYLTGLLSNIVMKPKSLLLRTSVWQEEEQREKKNLVEAQVKNIQMNIKICSEIILFQFTKTTMECVYWNIA